MNKTFHIPGIPPLDEAGRRQLLELFSAHVYGRTPNLSAKLSHAVCTHTDPVCRGGKNVRRDYTLYFTGTKPLPPLRVRVWTPDEGGPFPTVMMLDPFEEALHKDCPPEYLYGFFPMDVLTDVGLCAVQVLCGDVCADDKTRWQRGVLGEGERAPDGWGALGAWAWAGSRALDFLLAEGLTDPDRAAVVGCSRAGKTALWCAAQDTRFSMVYSNVSGLGGAALTRGKRGEHIADITKNFPFWFCPRYAGYKDAEDALPVDQHQLLALIAPRALYVSSAAEDLWADPEAEYRALRLASAAWPGVTLPERAVVDTPILCGPVGYHVRGGFHDLICTDWMLFCEFCKTQWSL